MELAHPLGLLMIVLDEVRDQFVRAFAHLVVDPRFRRACPYFLEGLRPHLEVQVVGVDERPVYIQERGLYQSHSHSPSSALVGTCTEPRQGRGVPPVTPRVSPLTKLDSWEARKA